MFEEEIVLTSFCLFWSVFSHWFRKIILTLQTQNFVLTNINICWVKSSLPIATIVCSEKKHISSYNVLRAELFDPIIITPNYIVCSQKQILVCSIIYIVNEAELFWPDYNHLCGSWFLTLESLSLQNYISALVSLQNYNYALVSLRNYNYALVSLRNYNYALGSLQNSKRASRKRRFFRKLEARF